MTRLSLNRRHIFLFDAAVIVCKRRGDNYEMKEVIDLHLFKITNNPTSDKETRKVGTLTSGLTKPDFTLTDTADTLKARELSHTERHNTTQHNTT